MLNLITYVLSDVSFLFAAFQPRSIRSFSPRICAPTWDAAVPKSDLILFNGISLPLILRILIFLFGVHDDSFVDRVRFELTTSTLSGWRSNQLIYRSVVDLLILHYAVLFHSTLFFIAPTISLASRT